MPIFRKSAARANSLSVPPMAEQVPDAMEVLRVWTSPSGPVQVTLRTTWEDPGAWGLLLVDIARHAVQAYAREGVDQKEALERIRLLWVAETDSPTDDPVDLTPNV